MLRSFQRAQHVKHVNFSDLRTLHGKKNLRLSERAKNQAVVSLIMSIHPQQDTASSFLNSDFMLVL